MTAGAALGPRITGKPRTTPASDGQPTLQVNSRFQACAQVTQSPGLSLARRKPGVQIPSPPPPTSQVRASPASSRRRSPLAAAAPRPRPQVAVQLGRLAATRRLGPGPSSVTTERGRRLQPEHASAATPDSPEQKPPWLTQMVEPFADTAGRPDPAPPGRMAARRTDALQEVTGADTADADAERADTDPGTPDVHPGQWTADRGHHPRGHWTLTRTPDTGRVDATEYPDRATSTRQAPDRHPGPPRPPDCTLGRRTVDLWTAPAAPGNDEGSATVRYLPARDYLQHYQAPARSLRRPSRALAHCPPPTITGRA